MVTVAPRTYCIVENPVLRNDDKVVQLDALGQAKLNHSDLEVRLAQDPFPLYPGEILKLVRAFNLYDTSFCYHPDSFRTMLIYVTHFSTCLLHISRPCYFVGVFLCCEGVNLLTEIYFINLYTRKKII